MKPIMRTLGAVMTSVMLFATLSCNSETPEDESSAEEVKRETRELLDALGSYTADQREEALERSRDALDRLDERIEALDAKVRENWSEMDAETREQTLESLEALRERRMKLAEWYGGMKNSAGEAWQHVKGGFSDAYRSFSESLQESEEELGDESQ